MIDMKAQTFGIEIETVGLRRGDIAKAIAKATGGRAKYDAAPNGGYGRWETLLPDGRSWKVVRDGSLSGGIRSGEAVSPILTEADFPMVRRVAEALSDAGARADSSCGLHIHVGAPEMTGPEMANLVKLTAKMESYFTPAFGIEPRRIHRYCRPVEKRLLAALKARTPETREEFADMWYEAGGDLSREHKYNSSRYHGLNLHALFFQGTVEYRYFNGTLDPAKIVSYALFAMALTAKARNAKAAQAGSREYTPESARYDWRVFLNDLGVIGAEYAEARTVLTAAFSGDCSTTPGRRLRRTRLAGLAEAA
ncbi:MAG: amidoligase family protein [Deltaproteobacteria bacterium]|jgi:hypothetical protein|nr:amidoligase family protein [Deltaproteobacteria bacterium]